MGSHDLLLRDSPLHPPPDRAARPIPAPGNSTTDTVSVSVVSVSGQGHSRLAQVANVKAYTPVLFQSL